MGTTLNRILPVLVLVLATSCLASCGGSDGTRDAGAEAGTDGTTPKKDGGPPDGHSDDSPRDGHLEDSRHVDAPVMEAGIECHGVEGDGSTLMCTWSSAPEGVCALPYVPGPCPSADLAGCCLPSPGTATCYYSSDATSASQEKASCKSGGGTWVTSAP
jgi:hypothetical protein